MMVLGIDTNEWIYCCTVIKHMVAQLPSTHIFPGSPANAQCTYMHYTQDKLLLSGKEAIGPEHMLSL